MSDYKCFLPYFHTLLSLCGNNYTKRVTCMMSFNKLVEQWIKPGWSNFFYPHDENSFPFEPKGQ